MKINVLYALFSSECALSGSISLEWLWGKYGEGMGWVWVASCFYIKQDKHSLLLLCSVLISKPWSLGGEFFMSPSVFPSLTAALFKLPVMFGSCC